MAKKLSFNELSLLSTPQPLHSSSMTSNKPNLSSIDDMPERLGDSNNSLGLLSIHSDDVAFDERRKQRDRALTSLNDYAKVTSIPSRYLKKTEITSDSSLDFNSESTISESDLLPDNSSTPRGSLFCDEVMRRERQSISQSISQVVKSIRNSSISLDKIFTQEVNTFDMFEAESDPLARLEQDEISWKNREAIPAEIKDFSFNMDPMKMSIGSFFQQRSDEPFMSFAKSPLKDRQPIALIDTIISSPLKSDSITESAIENVLSSNDSVTNILDKLYNYKKPVQILDEIKENLSPENVLEKSTTSDFNDIVLEKSCSSEFSTPENHLEKSSSSSRSSSSLSSLPDGRLPIATTKKIIVWGCTRAGKSITQNFVVRNRAANRFALQCSVTNPSFRLSKDGEISSILKITLHPFESKTLSVTFTPTAIGPAVDTLSFTSIDQNLKQNIKQFMKLFAYGGHGHVNISNLIKDTSGKYLMSLGDIDEELNFKQKFVIKNTGTLTTFTHFNFIVTGLNSSAPNLEIIPKVAVLLPGEQREVIVSCQLEKHNFNFIKTKFNSSVIDYGKILITQGTEVDRFRLKQMCERSTIKRENLTHLVSALTESFPEEIVPDDVKSFKENLGSLEDIMKSFNSDEITVTFQQQMDHTVINQLEDETVLFQSLCENTTLLNHTVLKDAFLVEPSRLIFNLPFKLKDSIFLTNNKQKGQCFEVSVSPSNNGLNVKPQTGLIKPGDTFVVELECNPDKCIDKTAFRVRILIDNDSFDVNVKVVFLSKR